jgi:hypothetical protein
MSNVNNMVPSAQYLRLAPRLVPIVSALLVSGLVSCTVSGVITLYHTGFDAGFPLRLLHVWMLAWLTAFPCVAFFGPPIRRIVERLSA